MCAYLDILQQFSLKVSILQRQFSVREGVKAGGRGSRQGSRCVSGHRRRAGSVWGRESLTARGMERAWTCLGSLGPLPWRDLGQECRDYSGVEHNPCGGSRATRGSGERWGGLAPAAVMEMTQDR